MEGVVATSSGDIVGIPSSDVIAIGFVPVKVGMVVGVGLTPS